VRYIPNVVSLTKYWNRKFGIRDYPTREEALEAALSDLEKSRITNNYFKFLVGPASPYWPLGNQYIQETPMSLRRAAQILQNVYTSPGSYHRGRVLHAVWRFVTQYHSYEAADQTEAECLRLTEDVIDDIDIYGELNLEIFYEEMKEFGEENFISL
jgi:hypothetical protein